MLSGRSRQVNETWIPSAFPRGKAIRVINYVARSSEEFKNDQSKYFVSKSLGVVVQDSWQERTGKSQ